jgi:nitrate reductase NapAB chaperone NapD
MTIAGIVATLTPDHGSQQALHDALASLPEVTPGPLRGNRMALVLETATMGEQRMLWERLQALPGVVSLTLAYTHFGDSTGNRPAQRSDKEVTP